MMANLASSRVRDTEIDKLQDKSDAVGDEESNFGSPGG